MEQVWVVIDVGCIECGVESEPVGIFATEAEAIAAQEEREKATGGWRDGGQTICDVYAMRLPATVS